MNGLYEDVKDLLIDNLYDYEGTEHYGADLSWDLLESENVSGSITYNRAKSYDDVINNMDDYYEVAKNIKEELDDKEIFEQFFTNIEAFQVKCYLEVASELLGQCQTVEDNWDDKFELTPEVIDQIVYELNAL